MASPEGQWWRCDCQARLRKSVPFLSPGCSLRGRHLGRIRLLWGCAHPLLSKQGLPGTGRWGSHTPSPGPQPPMAAAFPAARPPRVLPAARHAGARHEPAVPPPFPLSHGLQMGFYCILFCNGSGAVHTAGLRQVVSPPAPAGGEAAVLPPASFGH